MTLNEYLLSKLSQECAEVIQRATKAQEFGLDEVQEGQELNNRERLTQEVTDLQAVIDMLTERCLIDPVTEEGKFAKREKVIKWMSYSRKRGTLTFANGEAEAWQ